MNEINEISFIYWAQTSLHSISCKMKFHSYENTHVSGAKKLGKKNKKMEKQNWKKKIRGACGCTSWSAERSSKKKIVKNDSCSLRLHMLGSAEQSQKNTELKNFSSLRLHEVQVSRQNIRDKTFQDWKEVAGVMWNCGASGGELEKTWKKQRKNLSQ